MGSDSREVEDPHGGNKMTSQETRLRDALENLAKAVAEVPSIKMTLGKFRCSKGNAVLVTASPHLFLTFFKEK
jgi:hypothetical protein